MKMIKRCVVVEPASSSSSFNRQNVMASTSTVGRQQHSSRHARVWPGSMSFNDKRLELMYDRYVAKFGDYGVSMLTMLLSLGCLTEQSHDYDPPLVCMSRTNHQIHVWVTLSHRTYPVLRGRLHIWPRRHSSASHFIACCSYFHAGNVLHHIVAKPRLSNKKSRLI